MGSPSQMFPLSRDLQSILELNLWPAMTAWGLPFYIFLYFWCLRHFLEEGSSRVESSTILYCILHICLRILYHFLDLHPQASPRFLKQSLLHTRLQEQMVELLENQKLGTWHRRLKACGCLWWLVARSCIPMHILNPIWEVHLNLVPSLEISRVFCGVESVASYDRVMFFDVFEWFCDWFWDVLKIFKISPISGIF